MMRSRQIFVGKVNAEPSLTGGAPLATKYEIRQAFMRSAVRTIREVEKLEHSIGGVIRYAVISTGMIAYSVGISPEYF
jgi:hypothetical protein